MARQNISDLTAFLAVARKKLHPGGGAARCFTPPSAVLVEALRYRR
ncbi:DNA-binding transcriptional LysR family regulator [Bradyrhizobium sp. AZCC 1719]